MRDWRAYEYEIFETLFKMVLWRLPIDQYFWSFIVIPNQTHSLEFGSVFRPGH